MWGAKSLQINTGITFLCICYHYLSSARHFPGRKEDRGPTTYLMSSDFQAVDDVWEAGGRGFLPMLPSRNKEVGEMGGIGYC